MNGKRPGLVVTVSMPAAPDPLPSWREALSVVPGLVWVVARPAVGRDALPAIARDLLHATGAVGLKPPRAAGERWLHRGLAHLAAGGYTDAFIHGAELLSPEVADEVTVSCNAVGVRVWMLIEGLVGESLRDWLTGAAGPDWTFDEVISWWDAAVIRAHLRAADCLNPLPLVTAAAEWHAWTNGCCAHGTRIGCLLAKMRRDFTRGAVGPHEARELVSDISAHATTTVADRWELAQVAQDLWTPAESVLLHLAPNADARRIHVQGLSADGAVLTLNDGTRVSVPSEGRPLLRRQAAYSRLTNGPGDFPLLALHSGVT